MKVAIVHDDFMQWGGAERVVKAMAEIWPDAPIYTIAYDENVLPHDFPKERLRASFLQKKLLKKLFYPKLFFLDPFLFELFDFNNFDVVISSSTRFAKSLVTQPQTIHIAYINSPPRFLWPVSRGFTPEDYVAGFVSKTFILFRPFIKMVLPMLLSYLRIQDYAAAQRPDYIIANSGNVARRIRAFYRRGSDVLYPFVELERFTNNRQQAAENSQQRDGGEYFLIISRLSEHKRVDLAIDVCNELKIPLKIIGTGSEMEKLRTMAGDTVEVLGFLSDEEVESYLHGCKAFIYPQEEDFGITAIEAQASGKPVIAYNKGGATETVIDGETGILFEPQTKEGLKNAIKQFNAMHFDADTCVKNAKRFSRKEFKNELKTFVETKYRLKENRKG